MNTRILVRHSGVALAAALASVFTMVSFVAAFDVQQPLAKVVVKFGDLNLERPEGIAVLYQRLQTAATRVCQPANPHDPVTTANSRGCVASATARAVGSVNIPALTSYYKARNPHEST